MEPRQLNIFRILAHELNFTRAAKKAHCVQSNVTVQIREIEQELGVPLFERLGKQVRRLEGFSPARTSPSSLIECRLSCKYSAPITRMWISSFEPAVQRT